MRALLFAVLAAVLVSSPAQPGEMEVQTSWYLGPGELGPVVHWGERFYDSDSVAYLIPGQLMLMAASTDYNSWTKHTIELNPSIEAHANILPVDLNGDGYVDLVSVINGTENKVVWYERGSGGRAKGYTKHVVGDFLSEFIATIWPWDMDLDGDIDIVASGDEGLVWFENGSLTFTKRVVDGTDRYLYARPGDVDNDGDVDIVVHDKSEDGDMFGDLWLFRNDGTMGFSRELVWDTRDWEIWRINLADFNGDGFLDIQTSCWPVYVFLNDGAGHFARSYLLDLETDGSWPSDFDADGDVDIMVATWGGGTPPTPLFWLENDGTGTSFQYHLIGGESGDYGDGGMATDVNLDGLMDAVGTYRYVGWFEQKEDGSFIEHQLPDGDFFHSHWVYAENLDGDPCTGDVDIDIVATKNGEFAWWENCMVSFAAHAWLESSILDAQEQVSWDRFGWDDHVPDGNQLGYRVRAGATVDELLAAAWSSPILFSGDSLSAYGVPAGQYFQYRIEFERTTGAPDRSPTVYEVWVDRSPLIPPGLVTGGGWIPGDPPLARNKRTFGFNAHSQAGLTWGQLQFIDHKLKLKVHSETMENVVIQPGDTIADFSGTCRVDGATGYSFECEVMDRGEPGRGLDKFSINICDPDGNPCYSAGDYLGGGNIQIHTSPGQRFAEDASNRDVEPVAHPNPPPNTKERSQALLMAQGLAYSSPNPCRQRAIISYQLPRAGHTSLKIYDLTGQLVRTLVNGTQPSGHHALEWDGKDSSGGKAATGVYVWRLTTLRQDGGQVGNRCQTGKIVMLE